MTNEIFVVNVESGISEQREMTESEIAADSKNQNEASEIANKIAAKISEKATAKAALLAQLGITEEQAKLLLS